MASYEGVIPLRIDTKISRLPLKLAHQRRSLEWTARSDLVARDLLVLVELERAGELLR